MLKNDVNFILWKFVGPIICKDVGKMGEGGGGFVTSPDPGALKKPGLNRFETDVLAS